MNTLRLLFWLRWRIALNTTSVKSRWANVAITALFALAFSPLYVGGAIGAWALARKAGPASLLIVFGLCHVTIVWVSLLTGAMGRLFELDKLKRYPLRPFDVFTINLLASLGEPVVIMTLPSVVAAVAGTWQHSGALAGLQSLAGGIAMLLVTAALLQLLLALLDDLLRREWMRYVAAFFFTSTIIGFQLLVSRNSSRLASEARRSGFTPQQLFDASAALFAKIPTVAAPASLGGAHPAGWFAQPWVGALACALLIAIPIVLGARVMAVAVLRPSAGGSVARRGSSASGGPVAALPFLDRVQSLLLRRELTYLLRTPAVLYQMAVVPLTVIGLSFLRRSGDAAGSVFLPAFVMTSTLAGRNLMLWGYDGPGVRTLFLMPLRARDLVLTKNLAWFTSTLLEGVFVVAFLTALHPAEFLPQLPILAPGYLAVVFAAGVIGTWVSLSRPIRPPQQGMARRSPGGAVGLGAFLVILVVAGVVVLAVWAVRALTPDAWDTTASVVTTALCLAISAGIWWVSVDRNAELLDRQREKLAEVLGKSADV